MKLNSMGIAILIKCDLSQNSISIRISTCRVLKIFVALKINTDTYILPNDVEMKTLKVFLIFSLVNWFIMSPTPLWLYLPSLLPPSLSLSLSLTVSHCFFMSLYLIYLNLCLSWQWRNICLNQFLVKKTAQKPFLSMCSVLMNYCLKEKL